MTRSRSLQALFASLLVGCGPQVLLDEGLTEGEDGSDGEDASTGGPVSTSGGSSTPGTSTSTSPTTTVGTSLTTGEPSTSETATDTSDDVVDEEGPGCDPTIYVDVYEVPLEAIQRWLDADGQVIRGACWDACGAAGNFEEIVDCRVLDGASDGGGTLDGDDGTPPPEPTTTFGTTVADSGDTFDSGESGGAIVLLECDWRWLCFGGRGHAALQSTPEPTPTHAGNDAIGQWAASAAHAEAASVAAFLALHRELVAHGAPDELCTRALEAARDEVAHARVMGRIAARRGARVRRPRFGPVVVRDLESIAIENAVEGCVRETWAALEASHQACAAIDADVRAAMRRIAVDETRHAELARDIDAWARTQLSERASARIDRARATAIRGLLRSIGRPRDAELSRRAGLPTPATAQRLAAGLRQALWS